MPDGMTNVDATVLKLAKQYHDANVRSGLINDERKAIRENAEKLGIDPGAFQVGVRMAQAMTLGERSDFTGSLTRVLAALDGQESDLFGEEEIRKRDERKAKAAEKAAKAGRTQAELDAKTDTDAKSDPKSGGAGKGKKAKADQAQPPDAEPPIVDDGEGPEGETGDEMILRVSKKLNAEREQREGAAALSRVNIGENGKPVSQSAQAAAALEKARLN